MLGYCLYQFWIIRYDQYLRERRWPTRRKTWIFNLNIWYAAKWCTMVHNSVSWTPFLATCSTCNLPYVYRYVMALNSDRIVNVAVLNLQVIVVCLCYTATILDLWDPKMPDLVWIQLKITNLFTIETSYWFTDLNSTQILVNVSLLVVRSL